MSLHALANHMAATGRGPDSTLVHMTPKEVDGLQALAMRHGGSLTINPQTGLPEAGFLSSILPMLGGMALAATGIGAPAAALLMGGGTAIATGDLKKGLMAGLGAYGGAGLGESLIGSGAAGMLPQAAAEGVASAVPEAAGQAGLTMPSAVEPSISASLPSANAADPFRLGSSVSQETLKTPVGGVTAQSPNYTPPITTTPSPYSNVSNATAGGPMSGPSVSESMYPVQPPSVENMTASQRFDALKAGATGQNLLNYAKANPLQTAGMVAGPLMSLSENNNPSTPTGDSDRGAMANAGYEYDPGWADPTPAPDPNGREQRYNRPRYYIPKAADGGEVINMAGGGMYNLGSYSDGGRLLRGPGDGVSDSIPAVIGRKQPARLADGEFVVPARIVSEIGNGSTEAGARKLYAMMDRVQKSRRKTVGKGKIAKNTRADRYLPA
jgi:hypothetical protein